MKKYHVQIGKDYRNIVELDEGEILALITNGRINKNSEIINSINLEQLLAEVKDQINSQLQEHITNSTNEKLQEIENTVYSKIQEVQNIIDTFEEKFESAKTLIIQEILDQKDEFKADIIRETKEQLLEELNLEISKLIKDESTETFLTLDNELKSIFEDLKIQNNLNFNKFKTLILGEMENKLKFNTQNINLMFDYIKTKYPILDLDKEIEKVLEKKLESIIRKYIDDAIDLGAEKADIKNPYSVHKVYNTDKSRFEYVLKSDFAKIVEYIDEIKSNQENSETSENQGNSEIPSTSELLEKREAENRLKESEELKDLILNGYSS